MTLNKFIAMYNTQHIYNEIKSPYLEW